MQKEFTQIFRQKAMIAMIFAMPIIQLLILANAATFEINKSRITVIDFDNSYHSRELVQSFVASGFFVQTPNCYNTEEAKRWIAADKTDQVLQIPKDFGKKLDLKQNTEIQLLTNAIDGSAAGIITAYAQQVTSLFENKIHIRTNGNNQLEPLKLTEQYWFNPQLNYQTYIVPGLVVLLITIISFFLSGMNIVREKEIGTIDQINVTPIKKHQFIIGKLLPFLIIGLFDMAFGLFIGKLFFDIPFVGSLWIILIFAIVYLILMLGFGLLISTISNTQQQSLFISWFFMVIFILLSGLFTPIESMPEWVKYLNIINPIAYFVDVMRMVLLKGAQFADVFRSFIGLSVIAVAMVVLAVSLYRKTT